MMTISTSIGKAKWSLLVAFLVAVVAAPVAQAAGTRKAHVERQDREVAHAIKQVEAQFDCVIGGAYVRHVEPFSGLVNDHVRFSLSHTNAQARLGTFVNVPVSSLLIQENLPGGILAQIPAYVPASEIVRAACGD